MRTTLNIADDVLVAARDMARRQRKGLGAVVSELARETLQRTQPISTRNGIPQLPVQDARAKVTLDIVNRLRDG